MRRFRNRQLVADATEASRHRVLRKITISVVSMLMVLFIATFIALSLYHYNGSFTVSVDLKDQGVDYSLILSEDRDFVDQSPRITAKTIPDITNIAEETLPSDLDNVDGQHNGENYFAYTFYIKNNSLKEEATFSYKYQINIDEVSKDIDKGIRLRLYTNGEPETFARGRTDGNGAEPNTTKFMGGSIVTKGIRADFKRGEVDRYTIVLWIEGNDPDTKDNLIGGTIKFSMDFTVA